MGTATNYEYDGVGNLVRTTSPVDNTNIAETLQYYNSEGFVAKEKIKTDTNAYRETDYTYDELGRLSAVIKDESEGENYTKYFYDVKGNPIKVVTGLSADCTENSIPDSAAVTQYEYHPYFNSITKITKPDGTIQYFNYDLFGLLTEQGYTKNNTNSGQVYYTYDILGNLLSKTAGNKTETFTYDMLGNVTHTIDESGETDYTYDSLGRLTEELRNDGVKKQYTYDANNNRKTFKFYVNYYAIQQDLEYSYDSLNRVTSISESGAQIASYAYDKNGQLTANTAGTLYNFYERNLAGFVTKKRTFDLFGDGDIAINNYTYYLDGNVKTENGKTYTYDNHNRLSNVAEGSNNTAYTFDARGNRLTKTDDYMDNKVYDKNNRLTYYSFEAMETTFEGRLYYDVRGNMTYWDVLDVIEDGLIDKSCAYEYDGFGRMSQMIEHYQGYSAEYKYNSSGLRTSKIMDENYFDDEEGIRTDFILDGINVIAEVTDGDVTNYIRGLTGIIYRKTPNGTKTYYVTNNHGDVTKLVDSSGIVIQSYTYDEYGNVRRQNWNDTNPFLYCGEYYDEESGLIYLRARYYSPELGRFITEDPIRDDLNWYAYCGSNPINFWDPLGLEKIVVSGSEYEGNIFNKRYKGNFIDPAISRLKTFTATDEDVTWIVSTTGYSNDDINSFKEIANGLGVKFVGIENADELINYINSGDIDDKIISRARLNNKITGFEIYSHGLEDNGGTIELGYNQENMKPLSLNTTNIQRMNWSAFEGCLTKFYSCNTGKSGYSSFAQAWVNITGGKTIASNDKTDYSCITTNLSAKEDKFVKKHKFNKYGSPRQPTTDGSWIEFTKYA